MSEVKSYTVGSLLGYKTDMPSDHMKSVLAGRWEKHAKQQGLSLLGSLEFCSVRSMVQGPDGLNLKYRYYAVGITKAS